MKIESYLSIYSQTQELAKLIASHDGFDCKEIHHLSDGRARGWWQLACSVQELINGHEMSDIENECQEYWDSKDVDYSDAVIINELSAFIDSMSPHAKESSHNSATAILEFLKMKEAENA